MTSYASLRRFTRWAQGKRETRTSSSWPSRDAESLNSMSDHVCDPAAYRRRKARGEESQDKLGRRSKGQATGRIRMPNGAESAFRSSDLVVGG